MPPSHRRSPGDPQGWRGTWRGTCACFHTWEINKVKVRAKTTLAVPIQVLAAYEFMSAHIQDLDGESSHC